MSTSYSFAKSVRDESILFDYIKATFPTITSLKIVDNANLKVYFSAALTGPEQASLTTLMTNYPDPDTAEETLNASLSVFNTSTIALAGNASFAGTWEDCSKYSCIRVSALSNVSSASAGVSIQFGIAAAQQDASRTYSLLAGIPLTVVTDIMGRYFRVVFTNGASAQTTFSLATRWSSTAELPQSPMNAALTDDSQAVTVRSVMTARNDYSSYSTLRADEQDRLIVKTKTYFERQQTVSSTPWIQIGFTYGVNSDNCNIATVSGTVTASNSRALVASAAAINTSASISTDRIAFCSPGNTVLGVVSAAFTAGIAGNTQVIGVGTAENGLFFGFNGTSFGVASRSGSVTTWVAQSAWNVDKLDGSGHSGVVLNAAVGNTYAIHYNSLGYGSCTYMVLAPASNAANQNVSLDEFIVVHRTFFNNVSQAVGLLNPQAPLMVSSANSTATTAVTVYVASFCCFAERDIKNSLCNSLEFSKSVNSLTYVPVIVLYNNPTFGAVNSTITVLIRRIGMAMGGIARNDSFIVVRDPTSTNLGTLTTVSASSCVSYSTSTTSTITTGTGTTVFSSGIYLSHDSIDVSELGIYISPGSYLFFCCRTASGTASATTNTMTVTWNEV